MIGRQWALRGVHLFGKAILQAGFTRPCKGLHSFTCIYVWNSTFWFFVSSKQGCAVLLVFAKQIHTDGTAHPASPACPVACNVCGKLEHRGNPSDGRREHGTHASCVNQAQCVKLGLICTAARDVQGETVGCTDSSGSESSHIDLPSLRFVLQTHLFSC